MQKVHDTFPHDDVPALAPDQTIPPITRSSPAQRWRLLLALQCGLRGRWLRTGPLSWPAVMRPVESPASADYKLFLA